MDQEQTEALHRALIEKIPDPVARAEAMAFEALVLARETQEALAIFAAIAQRVEQEGIGSLLRQAVRGGPKESRRERKAREAAEATQEEEEISSPSEPDEGIPPSPQPGGGELHVTELDERGLYVCEVEGCGFARDGSRWADAHEATGSTDFDTLADWIAANPEAEVPSGD